MFVVLKNKEFTTMTYLYIRMEINIECVYHIDFL